jgi:predicted phage tail component-like protein
MGVTYNSVTADSLGLSVKDIKRSAVPSVENRLITIPSRDGAHYVGSNMGVRTITITFQVKEASSKTNLHTIVQTASAWLQPADNLLKVLTIDSDNGLYYMAKVDGKSDITEIYRYGYFSVLFICPMPYKLGTSRNYTLGVDAIVNNGDVGAPAIVTATFSATKTEFKIVEDASGQFAWLTLALVNTDVLAIDFDKQLCELNDANVMQYISTTSRFFNIPTGTSTYTVTPSSDVVVTIAFVERWF